METKVVMLLPFLLQLVIVQSLNGNCVAQTGFQFFDRLVIVQSLNGNTIPDRLPANGGNACNRTIFEWKRRSIRQLYRWGCLVIVQSLNGNRSVCPYYERLPSCNRTIFEWKLEIIISYDHIITGL